MNKLFITLLLLAVALFPRGASADTRYVVLAHGWDGGTTLGPLSWGASLPLWEAAGYTPVVVSLPNDNVAGAGVIRDAIDALPAGSTVHLVGHSMGGLSSRHYMKFLGGDTRVSSYTSIDSPQYGVPWVKAFLYGNMQMWSGSTFLGALNAPDATPGPAPYLQLTLDYPQALPGATVVTITSLSPTATHKSAVTDPLIIQYIIDSYTD